MGHSSKAVASFAPLCTKEDSSIAVNRCETQQGRGRRTNRLHFGEHLMAPQLPASALAAISGYIDRDEPAAPPAPAAATPQLPASALAAISGYIDRSRSEEPPAPAAPPLPPPVPAPAALREIEPLDASAVFALLHPDGPGYAVIDGVLGEETARRAARAAAAARTQLKRARVNCVRAAAAARAAFRAASSPSTPSTTA